MLDLTRMQEEHRQWCERNFGDPQLDEYIFGMVEEVGELAHHYLKMKQKIRGDEAMHREEMVDAVCDCFIFSMGTMTRLGEDYEQCLTEIWDKVKSRDWVKYPTDGKTC